MRSDSSEEFVPLSVPSLHGNEWSYVKECLDTNWVSSVGPFVDRFEVGMAAKVGTPHAVATVNGTAALHIALLVAGVQPDDEVLVSTLTFIAPANAIRYAGAWPVFIDAEADYWQIDGGKLVDFLDRECAWHDGALRNRSTGRRIGAIVPVHILGHPVDLDPICEVASKFQIPVIEDATESLGARYKGRATGQLGDLGCFSFNGNKIITTGGGGMLTTNSASMARHAKHLTTQAKDDPLEYTHDEIGYNYRLTNVQAAIGCAQLEELDAIVARKRRIAERYTAALGDIPGVTAMREASWAFSTFWLFTIRIDATSFGSDSRSVLRSLERKKIQSRPLWQPLHRSRAHAGAQCGRIDVADELYQDCLSLPCSADLRDEQIDRVVAAIAEAQYGN
jgi:perosamine synthetase